MTNISSATLTNKPMTMRRNANTARVQSIAGFGPIANVLILGVILATLGVLYLTQVTKTNAYGYQISDLKKQKQELITRNDQLRVTAAQAQSLDTVSSAQLTQNLIDEPVSTSFIEN